MADKEIVEKLDMLLEEEVLLNKKIVLFGANKASQEMCCYLKEKGCTIAAVVDNNQKKWGQAPFGVMTYQPEEFLKPYCDNYVVLIVSQYAKEMTAQLNQLGYELGKQIFIVKKLFRKYDTSHDAFLYFEKNIRKGQSVYDNVTTSKQMEFQKLFICPYVGNGDIYLLGQFLKPYCEKNGIENYLITVVGNSCGKIAKMFNWQNVVVLSQEDSDNLVSYVRFIGLEESKVMILNDCYQQPVNRRFRGYKGMDFYKMFQQLVFHFEGSERFMNQENLPTEEEVLRYVDEYGLEKGRSVILAPYANTISKVSLAMWQEIAESYQEKGYKVYTNGFGENEPPIEGTKQMSAPFSVMKSLVEYAGVFVGLRSGLCDIIASSNAKKTIFYPPGILFGSCSTYEYFSLEKMGLSKNVEEIEIELK